MRRPGGIPFGAVLVAGGFAVAAGPPEATAVPGLPAIAMPGAPHAGPLPPATDGERELATRLEADVRTLAGEIGERHAGPFRVRNLRAAEAFLDAALRGAGYAVEREAYEARGVTVANLVAERRGTAQPGEIVVVGAHYDSAEGTPGANDNGSGTAATLALARAWAERRPARTLRFVFFVNEEPPWFQTDDMGSLRHARGCRQRGERILAMLSLETLGYYADAPGTQRFDSLPPLRLLYPDTGNFVAFVADVGSADLARRVVGTFRRTTPFPAYGCALPGAIRGVGWSDHWSFWQAGYPGVMVTDTAVFRYPHYHAPEDTPDKLDYDRLARVVAGLGRVVDDLVAGDEAVPPPAGKTPPTED